MPDRTEFPHADVTALRAQISEWRSTRSLRSRLPDEMWEAATVVARQVGPYRAAALLGVSYDALRSRVDAQPRKQRHGKRAAAAPTKFLDVGSAAVLSPPADAVLEIHVENGRVTLRIPVSQKLDMTLVAAALWSVR